MKGDHVSFERGSKSIIMFFSDIYNSRISFVPSLSLSLSLWIQQTLHVLYCFNCTKRRKRRTRTYNMNQCINNPFVASPWKKYQAAIYGQNDIHIRYKLHIGKVTIVIHIYTYKLYYFLVFKSILFMWSVMYFVVQLIYFICIYYKGGNLDFSSL